jgi:hypothetical protein
MMDNVQKYNIWTQFSNCCKQFNEVQNM